MNVPNLFSPARGAAGVSRRASLMALGGAAAAVLANPRFAAAGKAGKKVKRLARKRCRKQPQQCFDALAPFDNDPARLAQLRACCNEFSTCDATTALECIFGIPNPAASDVPGRKEAS